MQNQYKIEIFDRDFNFVGYSIVERPEIDFDYLTLEETTLRLPRITAGKGDFAHVTDLYGSVIYDGIVSDVRDDGAGVELKVAPLLSLFDVQVIYDKEIFKTLPLEEAIEKIITDTYIKNEDSLQNLKGISVRRESRTEGTTLDIRSNIHAFWDIITKAMLLYDIVVECSLQVQEKEIDVLIAARGENVTLEAELDNVVQKSFMVGGEYGALNKITFRSKETEEEIIYYLHPDGSITTDDSDRITPVFFSAEYIEGAEDFREQAYQRAYDQMKPQKYEQNIELGYRDSDRMIMPNAMKIGTVADILYQDKGYKSILTGYRTSEGVTVLTFGAIRMELTKKLILERRKSE